MLFIASSICFVLWLRLRLVRVVSRRDCIPSDSRLIPRSRHACRWDRVKVPGSASSVISAYGLGAKHFRIFYSREFVLQGSCGGGVRGCRLQSTGFWAGERMVGIIWCLSPRRLHIGPRFGIENVQRFGHWFRRYGWGIRSSGTFWGRMEHECIRSFFVN